MRTSKFEVLCDNKKSFNICLSNDRVTGPGYGKPVVLVRADRDDTEDNDRGLKLAQKIRDFLNTLSDQEKNDLVADEMQPPVR